MPRILIVDDDPIVLEVLRGLLEDNERQILTAPGAAQALAHARAAEFAVALVDKNLGPDDGLALSRRLKEIQPEMEIILITGYASIESAIHAVQIGAFDYLTKPVTDFGALGVKVQSAIEKSALRRSQRALLERLMEAEVRHRRLIDAAPEAIVFYDAASGAIVEANEAAVALYGYEPAELLSLTARDLRRDAAEAPIGPHPVLQRHRRKDGSEFVVEATFTDFTQQGRLLKVQSARDVTLRLKAEEEHRDLQDRMRSAQKLDAIGRLAGGLAHDFSNLCALVDTHAQFLSEQVTSPEAKREVEGIRRAASKAAELIRQLQLFSRKRPTEEKVFDLRRIVSEVRDALSRGLMEHVDVRLTTPKEALPVLASDEELSHVLLNLAVNARDAMPGGGILSIELSEETLPAERVVRGGSLRAGRYAHLRVRDTGTGMSPEVQQRLFEPFFTTKPEGAGAGLGLATAWGIVSAAGGVIEVESQEGKGSLFHVWLPIAGDGASRPLLPEERAAL